MLPEVLRQARCKRWAAGVNPPGFSPKVLTINTYLGYNLRNAPIFY